MRAGVQPGVRAGGPGASGAVQKRPGASRGPECPRSALRTARASSGCPWVAPGFPGGRPSLSRR